MSQLLINQPSSDTSDLFYDGRLFPHGGLENQRLIGEGIIAGSGLRYLPVVHDGNTNTCLEEVGVIASLVENLTTGHQ